MSSDIERKEPKRLKRISIQIWSNFVKPIIGLRTFYYRTKFKLIYETRIADFNFINYPVAIGVVIWVGILYWLFYTPPVVLNLLTLSTQVYIAENVLRTISLFISIVFSFIVLSLNLFNKYFGRLAFLTFLTNKYIKFIFTLFITDVILLLYTCGYLKEGLVRTGLGDSLFVTSLILSMVLVFSIFPVFILLLRSAQNRDNIKLLIESFNSKWATSNFFLKLIKKDKIIYDQSDPINLLTEIGTAAIKDFDRIGIISIENGCIQHFQKLHIDYKQDNNNVHPYDFYKKVISMIRSLFQVAIKERNEIAAINIVELHFAMEDYFLRNFEDFNLNGDSEHHYDGIGFTVIMEEAFVKALLFNEDSVTDRIVSLCRQWFSVYIKEHLVKIAYDHNPAPNTFSKISSHYQFICRNLEKMFLKEISYKKTHLYAEVASFYNTICLEILASKNTRNTNVHLLQIVGFSNFSLFKQFIKVIDGDVVSEIYPFGIYASTELTKIKSQIPVQYELQAFDFLFTLGKLNVFVINSIKAIALHLIPLLASDAAYVSLFSIILRKFDATRGYINEHSTEKQKEVYVLLERYLGWIIQWLEKDESAKSLSVVNEAKMIFSNFKLKDTFNDELNEKGYFVKDHWGQ